MPASFEANAEENSDKVYRSCKENLLAIKNKKTLKVGAYLLSLLRSTIGGSGLDFRVRNENG